MLELFKYYYTIQADHYYIRNILTNLIKTLYVFIFYNKGQMSNVSCALI